MSNTNSSKQVLLSAVVIAVLVIAVVGVTFAFFNYTRTGTANTIRTGRIAFDASQSPAVILSDLFPIALGDNEEVTSSTPGVGTLTIHVTGDTDYGEGVEYLVKAVNVTGSNNNISLPVSISIGYEASTGQNKTIGTEDENYFSNRGGNTSLYKILSTDTISEGEDLVVGYIAPGETGIDGNIIVMAYLDARNIAITDTYDETDPETDTNGTTTNWVNNRTVLTTEEWNELQSSGMSFQIKVEAQEGTWVTPTISLCPGCKFIYTENEYFYSANNYNSSPISTLTTFENNNETLVDDYTTLNKNYFLGFKFDGNGVITNAYACGIKGTDYLNDEEQTPGVNAGTPFCIEGSTDGLTYISNNTFLNDSTIGIWQGKCDSDESGVICYGSLNTIAYSNGRVSVEDVTGNCRVFNFGSARCYSS